MGLSGLVTARAAATSCGLQGIGLAGTIFRFAQDAVFCEVMISRNSNTDPPVTLPGQFNVFVQDVGA